VKRKVRLLGMLNQGFSNEEGINSYLKALSKEHYVIETLPKIDELEVFQKYDALILFCGRGAENSREVYAKLIQIRQLTKIIIMVFQEQNETIDKEMFLRFGADLNVDSGCSVKEVHLLLENYLNRIDSNRLLATTSIKRIEQRDKLASRNLFSNISKSIWIKNKELYFTQKEYDMIRILQKNANQVLTYQEIYECVWNRPYDGRKVYVSNIMTRIRNKLKKNGLSVEQYIINIHNVGYKYHNPTDDCELVEDKL